MMDDRKHMQINGFRAEVLSDGWTAAFRKTGDCTASHVAIAESADSIKAAQRLELLNKADKMGFDTVVISRHIYATYDLRYTMSRRSARITKMTTYTKVGDRWNERKFSEQSCY